MKKFYFDLEKDNLQKKFHDFFSVKTNAFMEVEATQFRTIYPARKTIIGVYLVENGKAYAIGYVKNRAASCHAELEPSPFQKVIWNKELPQNLFTNINVRLLLMSINSRMTKYRNMIEKKQIVPGCYETFELERIVMYCLCNLFQKGKDDFIKLEVELFRRLRTEALVKSMQKAFGLQRQSIESYIHNLYAGETMKMYFPKEFNSYLQQFLTTLPDELRAYCVRLQL